MSNSGYFPQVLHPSSQRPQTQSQQKPFYYGASFIPAILGQKANVIGEGLKKEIIKGEGVKHKRSKK